VTAPGDEPRRARSSSVFPFATHGRRVEPHGLLVGLLHRPSCEASRKREWPLRRHSAALRRPRLEPHGHRRRTVPAPLGYGAEPRRQYGLECDSRAPRARQPPTTPTRLARRSRGNSSWLLQPTLSEARLQVALDAMDETWSNVFAGVDGYGRHAATALDAQMGAALPHLDTTQGPEDAPKVLRGHEIRIREGHLICLE